MIKQELDYETITKNLMVQNLNTPSFVTVANGKHPEGVIIARGRETVDHIDKIYAGQEQWYILQTNQDVWNSSVHDPRYNKAVEMLETQNQNTPAIDLVQNVLDVSGVNTHYTIFAVAMKPD